VYVAIKLEKTQIVGTIRHKKLQKVVFQDESQRKRNHFTNVKDRMKPRDEMKIVLSQFSTIVRPILT